MEHTLTRDKVSQENVTIVKGAQKPSKRRRNNRTKKTGRSKNQGGKNEKGV